jgi:thioredoxin 1
MAFNLWACLLKLSPYHRHNRDEGENMAIQVTDGNFEQEVLKSPVPVLVDFWAPWCGPCRAMGPIIDELATEFEGKVKICKMNVDENSASPSRFGIRAIPTLILFKDGEAVEQSTGAVSKSSIKDMIAKKA